MDAWIARYSGMAEEKEEEKRDVTDAITETSAIAHEQPDHRLSVASGT
jgi:hypothetical protein